MNRTDGVSTESVDLMDAPPGVSVALDVLSEVWGGGGRAGRDPRDPVVPVGDFYARGVCAFDLAWLFAVGLVECRCAQGTRIADWMLARPSGPVSSSGAVVGVADAARGFPLAAEFTPTPEALEVLRAIRGSTCTGAPAHRRVHIRAHSKLRSLCCAHLLPRSGDICPRWEGDLGELWVDWVLDGRVVGRVCLKHFGSQAEHPVTLLATFAEAGWPPMILDPLWRKANRDPVEQLRDTVRDLNRNQRFRMVWFRTRTGRRTSGADGCRVTWEVREDLPVKCVLELWASAARRSG